MKKLKTLLFIIAPFSLCAQINKNQWLVGGSVIAQYQTNSENDNSEKEIRLPLNVGYFVANKLAVGIRGQYHLTSTYSAFTYSDFAGNIIYASSIKQREEEFSVGPFIRYYILPKTKPFNVYVEVGYAYGNNKLDIDLTQSNVSFVTKASTYNINIAPVFFINKHTSMEFILAYYMQQPEGSSITYNNFLLGLGLQIHLGQGKE